MARLLDELESHPFKPTLDPAGPFLKLLNCLSDHAPDMPKSLKSRLKNPKGWNKLAQELSKTKVAGKLVYNAMMATTQAIDLVSGGVKVNALPEVVEGESFLFVAVHCRR